MRNRPNIDGLTRTERAICDLWDNGLGAEAIARRLSIPVSRVKDNLSMLNGADEHRLACKSIAAGSAQLLAALEAA